MRKAWVLVVVLAAAAVPASAEERPIGIEFNLAWPFVPGVGIYAAKAMIPVWSSGELSGELSAGFLYRPEVYRDTEGYFKEIGFNLGYRQYLWKGAHIELALWPGYGTCRDNVVDGNDYESWALTTEMYAGYRFDLALGRLPLYLLPQIGVGATVLESNPWPKTESEGVVPFFVGSLLVGISL